MLPFFRHPVEPNNVSYNHISLVDFVTTSKSVNAFIIRTYPFMSIESQHLIGRSWSSHLSSKNESHDVPVGKQSQFSRDNEDEI